MNIYRYSILLITAFVVCACIEETKLDVVNPQAGADVQFGLTLGKIADTRTVYGEENDDKTAFPIYWVNGDKVLIASPQCVEGRNSAEYRVSCSTSTQNYADELVKTGDTGIQWSSASTADFYSIYPSTGSSLKVVEDGVQATLKVASTQYAKTTTSANGSVLYAQPEDMGNVMMYAYSPNVDNDGNPVQLEYKPFSTVIEFEINAPSVQASGGQVGNIVVQSITLSTPEDNQKNIAGNFTFNFPQSSSGVPTIIPESTTVSKENAAITVHFLEGSEYKTNLTYGKKLKAKMCLMPIGNVSDMTGWVVTVSTSAGTFTKTITSGSNINTSLEPGMVHKIALPRLSYATKEWEYSNNNWITSIPDYRNVYLTELSLPGAWYAGGKVYGSSEAQKNYQATNDLSKLWNAGIRAFAVETKTKTTGSSTALVGGVVVSGTGDRTYVSVRNGGNSIYGGEPDSDSNRADGVRNGTSLKTLISNLLSCLNSNSQNEYAILIISYADGGDSGQRLVDHGAWLQMLKAEYDGLKSEEKEKIYTGAITEYTTVGDVENKLVIIVNVDKRIAMEGWVQSATSWNATNYKYNNDLPALFSYTPFVTQIGDYSNPHFSSMFWKTWSDGAPHRISSNTYKKGSGLTWCFSSANRTQQDTGQDVEIPKYENRRMALESMIKMSKRIYESSSHNVLFYFNCGGTEAESTDDTSTDAQAFARTMNSWLLEQIQSKNNSSDASPLGIVMFNQCTGPNETFHGADIIKGIIEMNSKFYLKHKGDFASSIALDDSSLGVDAWGTGFIEE